MWESASIRSFTVQRRPRPGSFQRELKTSDRHIERAFKACRCFPLGEGGWRAL